MSACAKWLPQPAHAVCPGELCAHLQARGKKAQSLGYVITNSRRCGHGRVEWEPYFCKEHKPLQTQRRTGNALTRDTDRNGGLEKR